VVIVLAGVHQNGLCPIGGTQRVKKWPNFHKVWPGGGYQVDARQKAGPLTLSKKDIW
jgi:hypothetical protein